MNRIQNILVNSPYLAGQSQRHRWRLAPQREEHPCPVVHIPPEPYGILQHNLQMGAVACTPSQACLLALGRTVEPFHMRGVDLLADVQLLNVLFNLLWPNNALVDTINKLPRLTRIFSTTPTCKSAGGLRRGYLSLPLPCLRRWRLICPKTRRIACWCGR